MLLTKFVVCPPQTEISPNELLFEGKRSLFSISLAEKPGNRLI